MPALGSPFSANGVTVGSRPLSRRCQPPPRRSRHKQEGRAPPLAALRQEDRARQKNGSPLHRPATAEPEPEAVALVLAVVMAAANRVWAAVGRAEPWVNRSPICRPPRGDTGDK